MNEALHTNSESAGRTVRPAISLANLKSRRTPIEWSEGIALIQELCRRLLESGVSVGKAFGPDDVVIDSAGTVQVGLNDGGDDESAVRQVGELLQLALADSAFPVPLRLVITQSASNPPFYASVAELSNALEYFERPDRSGLIRGVYERAQTLSPGPDTEAAPEGQQKKPVKKGKKPVPKDDAKRGPLPMGLIYAAAAAVAAIAIGAGVVAWSSGTPQRAAAVADLESGSPGASDRGKPADNRAPAPGSQPQVSMKDTGEATGSLARAPKPLPDVAPQTALEPSPVDQPGAPAEAAVALTAAADDVAADSNLEEPVVYSVRDSDVTPPVAAYPRLPSEPPSGLREEALSTLELLVSETGEVESVRLRGHPAHLAEALLATVNLSAAKTWRFVPAVKDGRPVKYRKLVRVWLTAS